MLLCALAFQLPEPASCSLSPEPWNLYLPAYTLFPTPFLFPVDPQLILFRLSTHVSKLLCLLCFQ